MSKDRLFLIEPGFQRPNRPASERFVCPECNIIEGLLASDAHPGRRQLLITRVPFERPREAVVNLIGIENQNLPALILGDEAELPADVQLSNGSYFINSCSRIVELLAERHGLFRL